MAQYYTDFSEYTVGQQPTDWTARKNTSAVWEVVSDPASVSGKKLKVPDGGGNTKLFTWNPIDADVDRADAEIFIIASASSISQNTELAAALRITDLGRYSVYGLFRGNNDRYIARVLDDQYATITPLNSTGGAISPSDKICLLFKMSGSSLSLSVWPLSGVEPSTPVFTETNSEIPAAGSVGVMAYRRAVGDELSVEYFSAGTGTDPAPRPGSIDISSSISALQAQAEGQDGYSASVQSNFASGTLYWTVTQSASAPTVSVIKAANSQPITSTGTQSIAGAGLVEGTGYYVHVVANDGTEDTSVLTSTKFTTSTAPGVLPVPTGLNATEVTGTSAKLNWTKGV